MLRFAYIANARIPTEKAHGVQIMKMCEALAYQDARIELILPKRINSIRENAFDYYKVKRLFSIVRVACIDLLFLALFKSFSYWLESVSFSFFLGLYFLLHRSVDIIYTRDLLSLIFLSKRQSLLICEVHNFPQKVGWFYLYLVKKVDKLVVISHGLEEDLIKLGVEPQKILVAPDGVDIEQFNVADSQAECRKKLHLPLDKKIAVYAGHLYPWKGVFTVLEAAKYLPEVLFVFVGGTKDDLHSFQAKVAQAGLPNILITGHKKNEEIPYYLKAADILLLPNSAGEKISSRYTSPLKLFEYMASGVPMVASDLPSLREILNEDNAILVKPDNAEDLAGGINQVLQNKEFVDKIAKKSQQDVLEHSWKERAKQIKDFIFS